MTSATADAPNTTADADRRRQLLAECAVPPGLFEALPARLLEFAQPFLTAFANAHQQRHALTYLDGLLSDLDRKNVEAMTLRHDHDRQPLQRFVGQLLWDHRPLVTELVRQVAATLGDPSGVLVLDPSGFAKKGDASVGVQRQWLGRLGKVDNGQVGLYLAYVGPREHALVDVRLYLPQEWTKDRPRCDRAGVPKAVKFATRHPLALAMLAEHATVLPHGWVTGDEDMGRSRQFRADLRARGEAYVLGIPCNTTIRDLESAPPTGTGRGRPPQRPWLPVHAWAAAQAEGAWVRVDVRDGERGPLVVDVLTRRVEARTEGSASGPEAVLVVTRRREADGSWKHDYWLAHGQPEASAAEYARVVKAEHRIEECLQRGKSEAGLADYEVRTYHGWYHHQVLSLVASWFLVTETLAGKKKHARVDGAAGAQGFGGAVAPDAGGRRRRGGRSAGPTATGTHDVSALLCV